MSMSTMKLKKIVEEVRAKGWARVSGEGLDDTRLAAGLMDWDEISLRSGDPPVTELKPTTEEEARANSLSAKFGLGDLPLHTDGAHLLQPPDIVILYSERPSKTRTVTWTAPSTRNLGKTPWRELDHGIFNVQNGAESFFTVAALGPGIRYDAGCMKPCDGRARLVAEYFSDAYADAQDHAWDEDNLMLMIDNRRTLHGRGAVSPDDSDRVLQRVAFRLPSK